MNCQEFQDHITAAVDRRLNAGDMSIFLEHAASCLACRREYEGECSIVSLIRARMRPIPAPSAVIAGILDRIAGDATRPLPRHRSFISSLWGSSLTKAGVAFALSTVAIAYIVSPPGSGLRTLSPLNRDSNDIVGQSIANYHAVLQGTIAPQIISEIPETVKSFFEGKTEFPVFVPAMKECTLVGAVLNEFRGAPLAHVMYKHGDQTIYVYQACRETVMKGEKLNLSPDVREELLRTGWYRGKTSDGAAIVIWAQGRTICLAISSMPGDHLMAHFVDANDSAP